MHRLQTHPSPVIMSGLYSPAGYPVRVSTRLVAIAKLRVCVCVGVSVCVCVGVGGCVHRTRSCYGKLAFSRCIKAVVRFNSLPQMRKTGISQLVDFIGHTSASAMFPQFE